MSWARINQQSPSVKTSNLPFSASMYYPMKFQKSIHNGKEKVGFFVLWAGSYNFLEVLNMQCNGLLFPIQKKWLNTI
jgi:hypothetical protein